MFELLLSAKYSDASLQRIKQEENKITRKKVSDWGNRASDLSILDTNIYENPLTAH